MNILYTYEGGARAQKAVIAAKYSNTPLRITDSTEFQFGVTNKSEEYLKKFPLGKIPALKTADGHYLTESVAIAYYVSNEKLKGTTPMDVAYVHQWCLMVETELAHHILNWILPILGIFPFNKEETEMAKEVTKKMFGLFDAHLNNRTFFVGKEVTLADINLLCNLLVPYKLVFDEDFRSPYANVNRWFDSMINQPTVKAVIGDVVLCKKMAQFDASSAKKYDELHPNETKTK